MKKKAILGLMTIALCVAIAGAQNAAGAGSGAGAETGAPKADGIIGASEYGQLSERQGMKIGVRLSADGKTLSVAVQAPTAGWVAAGLGSLRMNGAFMVLGYSKEGSGYVSEERGSVVGHKPSADKRLESWAVSETGGFTVLEFSIPAAGFLKGDAVDMIFAYGAKDDFVSKHSRYASASVSLK
ncbi:MAG TPA: DOMON domain-containing protein [Rectinemataceae bacterium]